MTHTLNINPLTQVSQLIFLNTFPLVCTFETGSHYDAQPVLELVLKRLISLPLSQVLRSQTRQPIQQYVAAAMKCYRIF